MPDQSTIETFIARWKGGEGVPFALIITLKDESGVKLIFKTFRQYLQTLATAISDIQVEYRVRHRA